jgi:hypothetical protein
MTQANTTRKIGIIAAVLMTLALTVTMVAAGNAHFVGTPKLSTSGVISAKVAGLGNIDQIFIVVSAQAQCVNPGHNKPAAGNKQTFSATGTAPVQNGKADIGPIQLTADLQPSCTGPMTIEWSNLTIYVYNAVWNGSEWVQGSDLLAQYPA